MAGRVNSCAGCATVVPMAAGAGFPPDRRRTGQATIKTIGTRYASQAMTMIQAGYGWMPSTPVSSEDSGVPGRTSQDRSNACVWPTVSQPASFAVMKAVITSPAATTTRTRPVILKKRARFSRTPPL